MITPQPGSAGVRVFPPAIHIAAIVIGFMIRSAAPVGFGNARPYALAAGCVVLAIAVGLVAWAALVMVRAGTTPNPTRPTTALVIRGPYRFTRNPMYLAWELVCIGVGLVANTVWPMVMAFPAAWVTEQLVIHKEEWYLDQKFGAPYRDYKARVRRWV